MLTKKFIISQIYIPFIFELAKSLDNEIIILTNSYSELILAKLLKQRRKAVTRIIRLKISRDHLNDDDFTYLEKLRGDRVKFLPDKYLFQSENITKLDCCLLTWNSCEFIEQYLINTIKIPAIIFELGYFRPNSLIIANAFTKHFPAYFLELGDIKKDTYGIENKYISEAWKRKKGRTIRILNLTLYFELNFNKLRPRPLVREVKRRSLKFYGPLVLKLLIKLSRLKNNIQKKKILAFFDQDPRDSSLLLDELYNDRVKNIKQLIQDAKKYDYDIIYRPHPLAINLKMAWLFYKKGSLIEVEGSSGELLDKSHIVCTYNSTVGFESLATNKPIIVLGNAFYKNNSGVFNSLENYFESSELVIQKSRMEYIDIIKKAHHFPNGLY